MRRVLAGQPFELGETRCVGCSFVVTSFAFARVVADGVVFVGAACAICDECLEAAQRLAIDGTGDQRATGRVRS